MEWWIYALITMLMFGITNFLVKVAGFYGMDSVFASIILWLAVGATGLVFLLYYIHTGEFQGNLEVIPKSYLLFPAVAGITLALGMYSIKIALTKGPGGPAVAIAAANAFIIALLAYIFLGEELGLKKIAGMVVIFLGILLMVM